MCVVVSIALSTALPAPVVTISPSGMLAVGQTYSLTCSVMVVPGLVEEPTIMWTNGSRTVVNSSSSGTGLELNFNPLKLSDADEYTCTASIEITGIASVSSEESSDVIVMSESFVV